MNPKSGKAGKAVAPADPAEAVDADDAKPGEVAKASADQAKSDKGKLGQTTAKPFKPVDKPDATWIEIELVDEDDQPVPGQRFQIELPDGSITGGTLDSRGLARVEGIPQGGDCKITFPYLDKAAWERV